jgi:hypothetical protein
MNNIKLIIACVCTVLAVVVVPQAKGWRGLVPLHSTRTDVERLLGAPKESHGVASTYETKDERVLVFYSAGQCKESQSNDWNVPHDTVVSITVQPNAKLLVDDLKLDKMKYERVSDYHVQGVVYYFSKENGVRISARQLEKEGEDVNSITYEPTPEDSYLRCPAASKRRTSEYGESIIRKFDEYSDISVEDEKARLDNFAIYLLKNGPQFKGYIIVYAPRSTRSGEAQARAKRAKDYLVKVRGIKATRIITINGGSRDRLEVELYALPSSMSPPAPIPYRDEKP